LGTQYVLSLRAVNCQSGNLLAQEQETATGKEQVLKALGQAATKLRQRLGESLASVQKYDALPEKMKAIIAYSVDAANADMMWKAIDRYSQDYIELQTKDKVKFYKTPDSILQKQLEIFDTVMDKRKDNALFVEIIESQKKFAERAVKWDLDTYVSRRMAYNYYFGTKPAAKKS